MPEARYPCPVCLGLPMHKLQFKHPPVTLDACKRCGGMWFDYGEVNQLKRVQPKLVQKQIPLGDREYMMQCHQCATPMERNADRCPKCHWPNLIDCPICQKKMEVVHVGDTKLDVCKTCKGAWFDNNELVTLWNGSLDRSGQDLRRQAAGDGWTGDDTAFFFLDALTYSPELIYYGADAALDLAAGAANLVSEAPDLAAGLVDAVGHAPDLAAGLIDGLGDLAGGIFDVIGEILSGLFDG